MAANVCAVEGCKNEGKDHVCPHDGTRHGHGKVHYRCGYPEHSLTFREGWHHLCDEHYAIVAAERQAFEQARA